MGFRVRTMFMFGLCAATVLTGTAVAQNRSWTRERGTRDSVTVFSELDLPTPNPWRLGSGAPGPEYWQQQVDYKINAVLDAETRNLAADMVVTYHNNAPTSLNFLWIQLEQNLFRSDSDGTKSRAGGVMRAMNEEFMGGYELSAVTSRGKDLEYRVYDTLARVDLPKPIKSGETFTFEISFSFAMPPYMRRMGAEKVKDGTIFEYAQWFPNVCMYDDVYGWNTLPYLGTGEFYTNYGNYEVNLTVPRDHLVSATGVLQNPYDVLTREQRDRIAKARKSDETVIIRGADEIGDASSRPTGDGDLTWRFKAENVRTFAWASSEAFVWDGCKATITDRDGKERNVFCQSMYPAEATAWSPDVEAGGSSQYVKHSIEFYSDFLYPYPYPEMTNINGPEGGMEYPMMVFCGGRTRSPFGVTDHEVGHSWFPMIVNTDERRHAWMDEGFNTFINMYSGADFRGTDPTKGRRRGGGAGPKPTPTSQIIMMHPDQMRNVGNLAYGKPGMGLFLLREYVLGPERFDAAFGEYIDRWVFKSPRPADFFRSMEDAAGMDLAWFWRGWFYEAGQLDQGIEKVEQRDGGNARVTFVNLGDQVMPVEFEVTYHDGSSETQRLPVESWFNSNKWTTTVHTDGKRIESVVLNPRNLLPDADKSNNKWEAADEDEGDGDDGGDGNDGGDGGR
jgi:Peptidase family M1 domain